MTTTAPGGYDHWIGRPAYDTNGDKIGTIEDVFYDNASQRPEWVSVTTGFFGSKQAVVPISGSSGHEDGLQLAYSTDEVKGAPHIDTDTPLSSDEERELYAHYGYDYTDSKSVNYGYGDNYRKAPRADRGYRYRSFDDKRQDWGDTERGHDEVVAEATVVNEEVQKTNVPETVRLRKYRHTEMVPVTKEEVRVEKDAETGTRPSGSVVR